MARLSKFSIKFKFLDNWKLSKIFNKKFFKIFRNFNLFYPISKYPIFNLLPHIHNFTPFSKFLKFNPIFKILTNFQNVQQYSKMASKAMQKWKILKTKGNSIIFVGYGAYNIAQKCKFWKLKTISKIWQTFENFKNGAILWKWGQIVIFFKNEYF